MIPEESGMDVKGDSRLLETQILTSEEQAELKKEEGNKFFKQQQYREAIQYYTEAIELQVGNQAQYFGNRAACRMMLKDFTEGLADVRQALKLDSSYAKGYLREARCLVALGDIAAAARSVRLLSEVEPANNSIGTEIANIQQLQKFEEDSVQAYDKGDFRKVVYCMDQLLKQTEASLKNKLLRAECLALLGRHQEAEEIANDVLQLKYPCSAEAFYVRGLCLYYQENVDKALSQFHNAICLNPDHQKSKDAYRKCKNLKKKKEDGNEAFRTGKFEEAINIYTEALAVDPHNNLINAKLHFNRAVACCKLNKMQEALTDCNKAIELDETYTKAILRRAKCYMDMEMYEEAVRDYEKICSREKTHENAQLLNGAKAALRRSKRKDYYKILGIEKSATTEDIKKAYRKRALVHHPDRHASACEQVKREQEKKFKEVGEAYSVLSDPRKRTRYDNGHDLEEMGVSDFDPTSMFQTFFGGEGPFGGGGGQSFTFSAGPGGFPRGFQGFATSGFAQPTKKSRGSGARK